VAGGQLLEAQVAPAAFFCAIALPAIGCLMLAQWRMAAKEGHLDGTRPHLLEVTHAGALDTAYLGHGTTYKEVRTTASEQAPVLERLDGEPEPIADSPFPIDTAPEPAGRVSGQPNRTASSGSQQTRLRRGRPRPERQLDPVLLWHRALQVREDLRDHLRLLDAGDVRKLPAAAGTALDLDAETQPTSLLPCHSVSDLPRPRCS
jgi:hypothetical protein